MNYKPKQQDVIWINFQPSEGQEISGRHPAVVISMSGYTTLTNLVAVCPITHAQHNRLKSFFIPISSLVPINEKHSKIDGYINPLQFYTFDISKRHAEFTGLIISDSEFLNILNIHKQILNI